MHVQEKEYSDYLENSLPADKQRKMKQHFEVCDTCKQKLTEWEILYNTIDELEFDFPLEGMEQAVLKEIKMHKLRVEDEAKKPVSSRILAFKLAYVAFFVFMISLFFIPYTNIAGTSLQNATNFMFNEGLDFINQVKWQAIDLITWLQSMNFLNWIMMLSAGIILIVGGAYYSLGGKSPQKA